MSHEYSENIFVRDAAGDLLENELHWDVAFAHNTEVLGKTGTFGRELYNEVLLVRYIRKALKRINPWITDKQIEEVIKYLERRISTQSLLEINEEKYNLIRDGVTISSVNKKGEVENRKALLIDFNNPDNNDFLAIKEFIVYGNVYHRRADIVGFVNGLPLLFIELKKAGVDVQNAYNDNYTDYQCTIPQLFYYNAFVMLSNGLDSKIGTLGSKYDFFSEWKRLNEEDNGDTLLDTMLRGICKKESFLDILENFILYDHSDGRLVKILARNHQYLGVNKAVEAYRNRKELEGRLGVFWHTQGSGKSYSMLFLAQKIRRKFIGSPTIVILTDRDELNKQISGLFENCGLLNGIPVEKCIASSGGDLITKLTTNSSYIFTLIQKFNRPNEIPLHLDHDVIIFSDEAHRSQYGVFADNLEHLLPDASKIGFTGTPLFTNDNIMQRTFGKYVSVYDFRRAVEDKATVPLFYENRGVRIRGLNNPDISDEIINAIEEADIDEEKQAKLEETFSKEIHILSAEPRLRLIARDFVRHYSDLWTTGKAMFVCYFLHQLHCQLVLVNSDIGRCIDRCKLMLTWGNFIVACLGIYSKAPQLMIQGLHVSGHTCSQRTEVMILKLLPLRTSGSDECASGIDKILAPFIILFVNQEVFLLSTYSSDDSLHISLAEKMKYFDSFLTECFHTSEKRRFLIENFA